MSIGTKLLSSVSFNLLKYASIYLPQEVTSSIKDCFNEETDPIARFHLKTILDNIDIAAKKEICLCQDTGLPLFFIKMGTKVRLNGDPRTAFDEAVKKATKEVPLRQNCIHPLTLKNTGNNTGRGIPGLYWEIIPEADYIEITAVARGFGSEIRSALIWVTTSEDVSRAALKAVLDIVEDSMGEPCPPVIIGVGIGGTSDISMLNAQNALLRAPLNSYNSDPVVAHLEKQIKNAVNETKLGAMGLGGNYYALKANVEISGAHTADVPISINFQCWAKRYSKAKIYDNERVEYITHSNLID